MNTAALVLIERLMDWGDARIHKLLDIGFRHNLPVFLIPGRI
jgi:hypothetical protein